MRFLNRPVFDERTKTWVYEDGSGRIPEEMRQDLLLAQQKQTRLGSNGIFVLSTLFSWKDRLKANSPQP
jgi:hypothetical protein